MTEILSNDEPINLIRNDQYSNQFDDNTNVDVLQSTTTTTTSNSLARKDSIVIPSISNSSISSAIQIEHNTNNTNNNNNNSNTNSLLPVCTSNSLGDLSSTPLLLLDAANSTSIATRQEETMPNTIDSATTFIQCKSFRTDSSSSSASSSSPLSHSQQTTPITHELLKTEPEDDIETEITCEPSPKKAPAPPPPLSTASPAVVIRSTPPIDSFPSKRTISQSAGEHVHQARRSLNRHNHQRHGSADLLYQQPTHEYLNRSSTTNSSFYADESSGFNPLNYYQYDQNSNYVQQLEHDLKLTKEQLNATMKSIKTFWSPELKKERNLRKDEACRYQLLINEHQKRSKQDSHIQLLEQQIKQLRDELEKSRHQQSCQVSSISSIPEPNPSNTELQKQYHDLKDKYDQRLNDLHFKDNECVTLKAKVDTYESKEKDLQHYITILKESILIKDQQVNMIQSEINDLRARLKEKDSIIEKKNSKIQSTRLDRQQRDSDLQESKQQLDIRDRKINVLNRKIENLEEQIREKSNQIALTRAKLSAVTTTASSINVQPQSSITTNTLVSNLETTIAEKERLIEKLREQKHASDIEHQEDVEQLKKTLQETRLKLEQKEKDYYEGQNYIIELKEQLNNSKSILQRRETNIQSLEQQIANLKRVQTDTIEINQFEMENRSLQERISSLEFERDEMRKEINFLQENLEQQTNSNLTLTNQSNEVNSELLKKKQHRIDELEQAVRESLQITTEREFAMTQLKKKIETLEKQIKNLQNEIEHLRNENHDQSQIIPQLQNQLEERKRQYEQRLEEQIKHLDNAFISQQEKLLGELSEKDSQIADLEMDRSNNGRTNMIERLNMEKQQIYNQLKELTEIRTKIIQEHLASKQAYEQQEKSLPISTVNVNGNAS